VEWKGGMQQEIQGLKEKWWELRKREQSKRTSGQISLANEEATNREEASLNREGHDNCFGYAEFEVSAEHLDRDIQEGI
jgi:hypothetical protein